MAQDNTYQTRVYHERSGNKEVVTSGGTIELQSGGAVDVSTSGMVQVQSGGIMDVMSGGSVYVSAAGVFNFFGDQQRGDFLRNFMRARTTVTTWSLASMDVDSATYPNLTPAYGHVRIIDLAANESAGVGLIAASLGDELTIHVLNCVSQAYIVVGQTGINTASLFNILGSRCSSLTFSASTVGMSFGSYLPAAKLVCFEEGKWSVVGLGSHDVIGLALNEA